jgi:hypothetical protein
MSKKRLRNLNLSMFFLADLAHHASWSMSDWLFGTNIRNEFLVDHIRPFPLRDVSCSGYADESRPLDGPVEFFAYGNWEHPILFPPDHQRWVDNFIEACRKSGFP